MFADTFIGSAANEDFVPMGGRDVVDGGAAPRTGFCTTETRAGPAAVMA
jgi:hypothetical protein